MHQILIDDDVLAVLLANIRSFGESQNDVLRRLLLPSDTAHPEVRPVPIAPRPLTPAPPPAPPPAPAPAPAPARTADVAVPDRLIRSVESKGKPQLKDPAPATRNAEQRGAATQGASTSRMWVGLREMIQAGAVAVGDELVCLRPNTGEHRATILNGGRLQLPDGREFDSPGGALTAATGETLDAWAAWVHRPSGLRLDALRAQQARSAGRPPR